MQRSWRRRTTPYVRWRQHGGQTFSPQTASSSSPQQVQGFDLQSYVNTQGGFTHVGWMSVTEVTDSMVKLGLRGDARHYVNKARLKHLEETECMFVLHRSHWVVVFNLCSKLVFFDPAGRSPQHYFEGQMHHVLDLGLQVQNPGNVMCANFCLFVCFAVLTRMPTSSKHMLSKDITSYLSRFLYFAPEPTGPNAMLLTCFTFNYRLGEEFGSDQSRYPKLAAFRRELM
ncbi:LO8 [Symphysodon discus adomavirus 1]|uniref:LO8 n=1 Tax=Symphysodon discus adomavirus 1 TaxID=2175118 RepID=A0A2S1MK48_9VIRU|nr:LO8 [Symphysodon discus adomavirus 1]AWG87408.1 LO8 [Symphysodon discus adomavirus 1]